MTSSATTEPGSATTPLWLSHHHPENAYRCVRIGDHQVCRRCLVMYPTVVVTALVMTTIGLKGSQALGLSIAALLLPFIVEWTMDNLDLVAYSSRRSTLTSVIGAVGLGLALAVHVDSPFDPWAVLTVFVVSLTAVVTAVIGTLRRTRSANDDHEWEDAFDAAEKRRENHLRAIVAAIDAPED